MLSAYEALPVAYRNALALTRAGYTLDAIAEQTDIPVERIRTWVLQAVLALTQARKAAESPQATMRRR